MCGLLLLYLNGKQVKEVGGRWLMCDCLSQGCVQLVTDEAV